MIVALARGQAPWGKENVVFILYVLDVILMHISDVILMHILDVLILMQILDVLLATTVIAPLCWELHRCNIGALAQVCLRSPRSPELP